MWAPRSKKKRKIDGHGSPCPFFIMTKNCIPLNLRLFALLFALTLASGCAPQASPTAFRPPTLPKPTQIFATTTSVPQLSTSAPDLSITATIPGPCTNNLSFLNDITIPDDTTVAPGSPIDKQWLVQNTGTCNWDSTYHLKWIGGDTMNAAEEQALYPARAGTQATLRILFSAPAIEDTYESAWQAAGSDGNVFGDLIFIKIVVSLQ